MSNQFAKVLRPDPMFLGYCLKQCPRSPEWLGDPRVAEIASVSECNARRPSGWVDRWDFNQAGLYNVTEGIEAMLADEPDKDEFRLFGYDFYPLRFDAFGNAVAVRPKDVFGEGVDSPPRPKTDAGAGVGGFEFLGYDAVQRWAEPRPGDADMRALGGGFGCSPLFCNRCSLEHPVNRHCLLTGWPDAVHAARKFAIDQPEPGCYYVFGIYRQPRTP